MAHRSAEGGLLPALFSACAVTRVRFEVILVGLLRLREGFMCVLLIVGDFLSPPAMDPPVSKELSSSSSAIHSSERGERSHEK